jgi:hypothetical protein
VVNGALSPGLPSCYCNHTSTSCRHSAVPITEEVLFTTPSMLGLSMWLVWLMEYEQKWQCTHILWCSYHLPWEDYPRMEILSAQVIHESCRAHLKLNRNLLSRPRPRQVWPSKTHKGQTTENYRPVNMILFVYFKFVILSHSDFWSYYITRANILTLCIFTWLQTINVG